MDHRIEQRDAFHVVGVRERFVPGKTEGMTALWHRFLAISQDVPNEIPMAHYGVSVDDTDATTHAPGFLYMACTGVTSLDRIPEGMAGFTVPAATYAAFTHRGPIATFMQTFAAIWREGLPAARLTHSGAPVVEMYGEKFRADSPESEMEVWVPVARGRS